MKMFSTDDVAPGDYVLVRAKVLQVHGGELGLSVELWSKTDQYSAVVRPDIVVSKTAPPIEPHTLTQSHNTYSGELNFGCPDCEFRGQLRGAERPTLLRTFNVLAEQHKGNL